MHDGEQVLARQPASRLRGIGTSDRGIVGGDEQRPDRRIVQLEQSLAEPRWLIVRVAAGPDGLRRAL